MENLRKMKNILIVDDEKSFLSSLIFGFESYAADFNTMTAENGKKAVEAMKSRDIDLVITDLKMPEMDGFELLAYLSRAHPGIPVIVMSAYCTSEIKTMLKDRGAFTILEKPIDFQDLVNKIFLGLEAVSEGFIQGITLPAFLQLVEMEKKTCTLRIESHGEKGLLYFQDGVLIDAETDKEQHEDAACTIGCWEDARIEIESFCRKKIKQIDKPLNYILMEGYRIKDERERQTSAHASSTAGAGAEPAGLEDLWPLTQGIFEEEKPLEEHINEPDTKEDKMAQTKEILNELAKLQGVDAVCLVARDGFLLDSIARTGTDTEMIAAIASSGFGASEAMGRQIEKGAMIISMIEFEKGPVMFSPIGDDAFLVIIAGKDGNLGMIRLKIKKYCGELAMAAAI
jgi:predicted regulator of Ras-like GTPase activity (Roadblock/LC7/MglB family)/ActR/RegA family two-component response regulator